MRLLWVMVRRWFRRRRGWRTSWKTDQERVPGPVRWGRVAAQFRTQVVDRWHTAPPSTSTVLRLVRGDEPDESQLRQLLDVVDETTAGLNAAARIMGRR